MQKSVEIRLRAETPVFSANCAVLRGRGAPTICTVPVCALVKVSTASVTGRGRLDSDPEGLVIFQPKVGAFHSSMWGDRLAVVRGIRSAC
jgi:hypothetical protein